MNKIVVPLIYVLAFVVVVILIQTLASLIFTAGEQGRRVNRRLSMLESGMKPDEVYSALVRRSIAPNLGSARLGEFYENVVTFTHQAGMGVSPMRLLAVAAGGAGVLWLLSLAVFRATSGVGVIVNGLMSLIGACILSVGAVWFWVNSRRSARLKKLEEQLPLALDIVNR